MQLVSSKLAAFVGGSIFLHIGARSNSYWGAIVTSFALVVIWGCSSVVLGLARGLRVLALGLLGTTSGLLLLISLGGLNADYNHIFVLVLVTLFCILLAAISLLSGTISACLSLIAFNTHKFHHYLGIVAIILAITTYTNVQLILSPNNLEGLKIVTSPAVLSPYVTVGCVVGSLLSVWAILKLAASASQRSPAWKFFNDIAIVISSWGSTSFYNWDLSGVKLSGSDLATADLRAKTLYRTCFHHTTGLERARVDDRYLDLSNPQVQSLLVNGTCQNRDLSYVNLRGAYLKGAILNGFDFTGADLSGANLQDAEMRGAILEKTQLPDADLSGADLSEICIQNWNINHNTRFKGAKCKKVYLRRNLEGQRLEPRPEDAEFEPGEFERWITGTQKASSLIFQKGFNREAFALALAQTALNHENSELLVHHIEDQQQGQVIAEVDVKSHANKIEIYQELMQQYQRANEALGSDYQLALQAKEAEIQRANQLFEHFLELIQNLTSSQDRTLIQGEGHRIYLVENARDIVESSQQTIHSLDLSSGAKVAGDMTNSNQNINISGGQLSNVQLGGQAGRDLNVNQSQEMGADSTGESLTVGEVSALLDQLKALLQSTNLPASDKERAVRSVETAKDEIQSEEPDKEFAAKSLRNATRVLKEAGETVEAGTGLWQKIKPILETVGPWLGITTSFFI